MVIVDFALNNSCMNSTVKLRIHIQQRRQWAMNRVIGILYVRTEY